MIKYFEESRKFILQALDSNINPETNLNWNVNFESEFCKFSNTKFAVAVNSGTSALHAALVALDVRPGDEVIIPAISVVMNAFTVINLGATPVWVDVEKETWNIDPSKIESAITSKTKVIVTISWFGLPAKNEIISVIAKKHNLSILDDSAETLHENYYDTNIKGVSMDGIDIRIFSLEEKKHFTSGGEGGVLVTNNSKLAEKARKFAGLGYKHLTDKLGRTSLSLDIAQDPEYERFDEIGLNYRMTPITAALALGQLKNVTELLRYRKLCANYFLEVVSEVEWLKIQEVPKNSEHTYYTFGILYEGEKRFGIKWKEFYNMYRKMGGDGFYGNVKIPYLEPVFKNKKFGNFNAKEGLCPVAELIQKKVMAFKTNYIDMSTAQYQANLLKELVQKIEKN